MVILTRGMLHDQDKNIEGKNMVLKPYVRKGCLSCTRLVGTTHVECELDFNLLDRLIPLKPKTLDLLFTKLPMVSL